jgi:dTDP-4-dehydrorhamnose reductase
MKILIFGKNGQVGFFISQLIGSLGHVFAFDSNACDFCNEDNIEKCISKIKPNVIINAAAYTNVDEAEEKKALCYAVNSQALKVMAKAADKINALIIHFSTDYVFDGLKKAPYFEHDNTNPINEYGKSKLLGEFFLNNNNKKNIIIRTSWIFSHHRKNFMTTILNLSKHKNEISIVNDQIGSPTSAYTLAKMVVVILKKYIISENNFPFGIYNISSKGEVTWYQFAKEIIKKMNILNENQIKVFLNPILTCDYPTLALRPKYSVLSNALFETNFNVEMPCWKDQINRELLKF